MTTFPPQDIASMNAFYGDPAGDDGQANPQWEAENIVRVVPPYSMVWSWNLAPVQAIRLHKLCAPAFLAALTQIGQEFPIQKIMDYQLNRCGGGYTFRPIRGATRLSCHAYGAAVDIAPELNPMGAAYNQSRNMIPFRVVEIFQDKGIVWGGLFKSRPDLQHFQAATI